MNGATGKLVPRLVVEEVKSVPEVSLNRLSEVEHAQENLQNYKAAIHNYVLQGNYMLY